MKNWMRALDKRFVEHLLFAGIATLLEKLGCCRKYISNTWRHSPLSPPASLLTVSACITPIANHPKSLLLVQGGARVKLILAAPTGKRAGRLFPNGRVEFSERPLPPCAPDVLWEMRHRPLQARQLADRIWAQRITDLAVVCPKEDPTHFAS